tara:strand:+ start:308 stop:634 length:327 start_codon:yes stop_codon:yes gene_type:complete
MIIIKTLLKIKTMKNITKTIDPISKARKHALFKEYSEDARARILLATEIYKARSKKGLTQQALAKAAETTQKVVSNIENGQVNVGLDLIFRMVKSLGLRMQVGKASLA